MKLSMTPNSSSNGENPFSNSDSFHFLFSTIFFHLKKCVTSNFPIIVAESIVANATVYIP